VPGAPDREDAGPLIEPRLLDRLYRRADAARWRVPRDDFGGALRRSASHAFRDSLPTLREIERYLEGLQLGDLALAVACAAGDEGAWEHFVTAVRPTLYRAADALDPSGGARDLADSLYGDLFGVSGSGGERRSLFRYFHGRSSLLTWLRAVLAQRHVDRVRAVRRTDPLPDEESPLAVPAPEQAPDPDRERQVSLFRRAVTHATASLDARDRLRLACYYAQQLTLAQTGRLLGEHEATTSRQLGRTRKELKHVVERYLREECGLGEAEVAECFDRAVQDPGSLDVRVLFDPAATS
jgi:RNA polymerase sigma-70 factor (ECF subfamily)